MIWFSSDLHLGHTQPFLYEPRGFLSINDHDTTIISNINEAVQPEDTLYLLGDLMLNDNENGMKLLSQIKCEDIQIILGNHDSAKREELYSSLSNVTVLGYAEKLIYKKWSFILSHYPMLTASYDDDKYPSCRVYNLCGHSHTKQLFDPITNSYHCELDAHNNFPVSIDQIREDIKEYCRSER